MALKFIADIRKANAESQAAHEAINPLLESAKITNINVGGKDVPAVDAPLADKIKAYSALTKAGDNTQKEAELIQSNALIASENEKLAKENATLTTANQVLLREKQTLETQLATSRATASQLTADCGNATALLKVSNEEVTRLTGVAMAQNNELSKACVACDCLALNDAEGRALPKNASHDEQMAAAVAVPYTEKFNAFKGAVNAAMAKTGVSASAMPGTPPGGTEPQKPQLKGADRMKSAMRVEGRATPKQATR